MTYHAGARCLLVRVNATRAGILIGLALGLAIGILAILLVA